MEKHKVTLTNSHINEKLTVIRDRKHYEKLQTIRFFILTSKLQSYTITTVTEPYFVFDWRNDIIDFDDVLKHIFTLELKKLKLIYKQLEVELPVIQAALQGDAVKSNKKIFFQYLKEKIKMIQIKTG